MSNIEYVPKPDATIASASSFFIIQLNHVGGYVDDENGKRVRFPTLNDAINYCERNNLSWD